MVNLSLEKELHQQLKSLPEPKQRQVLEYARSLASAPVRPRGVTGKEFLAMTGTIEPDDIELMKQAIEEGCERVDLDEW